MCVIKDDAPSARGGAKEYPRGQEFFALRCIASTAVAAVGFGEERTCHNANEDEETHCSTRVHFIRSRITLSMGEQKVYARRIQQFPASLILNHHPLHVEIAVASRVAKRRAGSQTPPPPKISTTFISSSQSPVLRRKTR